MNDDIKDPLLIAAGITTPSGAAIYKNCRQPGSGHLRRLIAEIGKLPEFVCMTCGDSELDADGFCATCSVAP